MFPLQNKRITGYKFKQPTYYSGFHLGVDYGKGGEELFAPFDGEIINIVTGGKGGNTIHYKPSHDNVVMRFLHLSEVKKGKGKVKMGEVIGITGDTGDTRGAHLHLDISKKAVDIFNYRNFIDPETYNWDYMTTMTIRMCVFMNYEKQWTNPFTEFLNLIEKDSEGKVRVELWPVYTSFKFIKSYNNELTDYAFEGHSPLEQYEVIKRTKFNEIIKTHGFGNPHITALALAKKDFQGKPFEGNGTERGWAYGPFAVPGDTSHLPNKLFIVCDEGDRGYYYQEWSSFTEILYHELLHIICRYGHPSQFDLTHTLHPQKRLHEIWKDIDVSLLAKNLAP